MNGKCFPVANSLSELASRGGYMTAAAGLALKNLYNTSTAVDQISTVAYTITFNNNAHSQSKTVTQSGKTARGQINIRRQSGKGTNGPPRDTLASNTTVTIERLSNVTDTAHVAFSEIYY